LYGLKQAPKQWHQKFNKVVTQFGFTVHKHDKYIYSKNIDNDYIIFCLYINDILIYGISLDAIQKVEDYLSLNFDMKDLGPSDMILEMKISRIQNGISLIISHNIERMLHKFDFYNFKSNSAPYDFLIALKKNTGELCVSAGILSINKFTSLYFQQN